MQSLLLIDFSVQTEKVYIINVLYKGGRLGAEINAETEKAIATEDDH